MSLHHTDEVSAIIGAALRALRQSKGLTQEQLAGMAGRCSRTIRRLEAGDGATLSTVHDVVEILDCQPADLFRQALRLLGE